MKNKLGNLFTFLSLLGVLVFGFAYSFKPSFMPYQAGAVSMTWAEVPVAFQHLIMTYMKAAGGGWLALAVVLIGLQLKFNQNKELWIPK